MAAWGFTNPDADGARYVLASWLFLRLLGLIYLVAFVSLATQIKGLAGQRGILPAAEFLLARADGGRSRFYRLPTLCWLNSSDAFLSFLTWGGAALSVLLIIGFAPMLVLVLLWMFYLSLFNVCRTFLSYQWDVLLLETGVISIFLAPLEILPHFPPAAAPSSLARWLLWWLLFRLMFSSGFVKLRSSDRSWRNLTALCHHYETQPLPTPFAWHAHQLPLRFHKISAVIMFAIELVAPFLIFGPPAGRHLAGALFMFLMLLIHLTGNYCFFNLLGLALSVLLFDDALLNPVFHALFPSVPPPNFLLSAPMLLNWITMAAGTLIFVLSLEPVLRLFRIENAWPRPLIRAFEFLDPFRLVNSYGLFSVMTSERPEIIVEGSNDYTEWRPYEFKWKPGDVKRAPRFVAPHQPRLDWQMWFAALGYYVNQPWFGRFLQRLLEGSPPVLSLMKKNPFPGAPPRYLRAVVYDYRFTNRVQRHATGAWWRREQRGSYCPPLDRAAS